MADQTLPIVESPTIADIQLPLPVQFNGLDQPVLSGYLPSNTELFVLRAGDRMTGALEIEINNLETVFTDFGTSTAALVLVVDLSEDFVATNSIAYGMVTSMSNGSSDADQTLVDIQIGPHTSS